MNNQNFKLSPEQEESVLHLLQKRFEQHPRRHPGLVWENIAIRLKAHPDKIRSLSEMERTGGEPDVTGHNLLTGEYIFSDCSAETPKGRRSICYDREALDSRKEHKPATSALEMAAGMGIEMLTEEQYRDLQKLDEFDTKTSSWIKTPPEIRSLGGALFCDRRFDHVFVYHNGAESYYAVRGFRGSVGV